jgi:CBS domain-containing protein
MELRKLMSEGIAMVPPEAPLVDAARRMREQDVGALPVRGRNGELLGIVTDRDIAVRAVADGLDPKSVPVAQVMTRDVQTCSVNREVEDAARLMQKRQVRRLVVVDANETPIGIVSLADLALQVRGTKLPADVLKSVSKPAQ